ncbi:MAG TPA: RNA methyltransferase [Pyrinomonadaceae bacterium]|jgi:TrmH family RNA methyltransferase|nr:RNA methyltransferase [Pyrinomonadaceae bacterium]
MRESVITSRDNALAKRARAVRDRKLAPSIFIEGLRLCEEALEASLLVEDVLCTERLAQDERGERLLHAAASAGARITFMSEQVFASVSDTKTPQGIALIASRPDTGPEALVGDAARVPLIVVMHRINNPSNAGAILRAAEAAGATGAIATAGATDLFSPRALRGAMGSAFRLPLWTGVEFREVTGWCAARGMRTVCADLRAARVHTEIDWTTPRALIVGAEASGLDSDEVAEADEAVRIPMRPPVESLNVAVASAILLYEAARQRFERAVR